VTPDAYVDVGRGIKKCQKQITTNPHKVLYGVWKFIYEHLTGKKVRPSVLLRISIELNITYVVSRSSIVCQDFAPISRDGGGCPVERRLFIRHVEEQSAISSTCLRISSICRNMLLLGSDGTPDAAGKHIS
jgi:hypothetical protein